MREEIRSVRETRIEDAAYELLQAKGYTACSMLSVARLAKSSNETMYKLFGDKVGLMQWLVSRNAVKVTELLESNIREKTSGLETLREVSPVLLRLLVSDRAIMLNRAAATDPTGELGLALAKAGRETVVPLLVNVFDAARQKNELAFDNTSDAVELYLSLLVGDLQIRRVIHRTPEPKKRWINQRAVLAVERLRVLLSG